jgi:hypothetical protein
MTKKLSGNCELGPDKKFNEEVLKKHHPPPGFAGSTKIESTPIYRKYGSEKVIQGFNNSFIVLGRDRVGVFEGKGFEPHPKCGSVDIVAGLSSASKICLKDKGQYSPNLAKDASRLYISQRSDVDNYFGLAKGSVVSTVDNKSCAVLKSDHTRIVGKEHVKIVAGKMKLKAKDGERNALGGKNELKGGIDLIGGNFTDGDALQPLVKGKNLKKFLEDLITQITNINSRVLENQMMITRIGNYLVSHVHGPAGTPSPQLIALVTPETIDSYSKIGTCSAIEFNMQKKRLVTYLNPTHDLYINSSLVKTT